MMKPEIKRNRTSKQKGVTNLEMTYTQSADSSTPNAISQMSEQPILGKYGRMRRTYLKENKKILYNRMLLNDTLWPHLLEIDEQAHAMVETMVAQMAKAEGVTEKMKSTDPMRWVGLMNNFKNAAEEIVLRELVYS